MRWSGGPASVTSMTSTPEFGGHCAFATSLGGPDKAPMGKPKYTLERDGKTYVFFGAVPMMIFKAMPGLAARAQAKWEQSHPSA